MGDPLGKPLRRTFNSNKHFHSSGRMSLLNGAATLNESENAERPLSLWKKVWERKGKVAKERFELADLLAINGYDTAASRVVVENWLAYVRAIQERLRISPLQ